MKNIFVFISFLARTVVMVFTHWRTVIDVDFYEQHDLEWPEIFRYKIIELMVVEQWRHRNPDKELGMPGEGGRSTEDEDKIFAKIARSIYCIYDEYFKVKF